MSIAKLVESVTVRTFSRTEDCVNADEAVIGLVGVDWLVIDHSVAESITGIVDPEQQSFTLAIANVKNRDIPSDNWWLEAVNIVIVSRQNVSFFVKGSIFSLALNVAAALELPPFIYEAILELNSAEVASQFVGNPATNTFKNSPQPIPGYGILPELN